MRTTVTLDPDAVALLRRRMKEQGVTFKEAVNDAIRAGLGGGHGAPFRTETAELGTPTVSLDRALQVAAELEDEDLVRRMRRGK